MSDIDPKIGDMLLVFDALAWNRVGHDVGDNSCFWKPARVMKRQKDRPGYGGNLDDVVDVVFMHRPHKLSEGHFVWSVRKIKDASNK
jgi:hypothetical protein